MPSSSHSPRHHTNPVVLWGWISGLVSFLFYRLTLAPTVSLWDCGEFIATSHTLGVGHPPGAPFYQLLAHLFTLLASTPDRVAFWSNMLSAVAGGLTASFLFWTLCRLIRLFAPEGRERHIVLSSLVGTLCYAFCDTAWFSAVESEVYSLSMLFSSVIVWSALRWAQDRLSSDAAIRVRSPRWLVLLALLLGLSVCVHLMSWLTLPAIVLLFVFVRIKARKESLTLPLPHTFPLLFLLFFLVGLSPYAIIPMRAKADPAINNTDPSTTEAFLTYVRREQYEQGPLLYPRIWRHHPNDAKNYADWSGAHGKEVGPDGQVRYQPNFIDNLQFFASYQLGFMYFRYFMWNFAGRHYYEYLMLPLLLGLMGLFYHYSRHRRGFWTLFVLFLFSGVGLAVYLNMAAYQPRERDYAFVLSFYAFALWIGTGAYSVVEWLQGRKRLSEMHVLPCLLLILPVTMCAQNYRTNDRSHNYIAHDLAYNMLQSCEPDGILFTIGDNDTFPVWYLQEVEGVRKDVTLVNLSLLTTEWYARQITPESKNENGSQMRGDRAFVDIMVRNGGLRPLYFSHYAYADYGSYFEGRMQLTGTVYRLMPDTCALVGEEALRHLPLLRYNTPANVKLDLPHRRFRNQHFKDVETIEGLKNE